MSRGRDIDAPERSERESQADQRASPSEAAEWDVEHRARSRDELDRGRAGDTHDTDRPGGSGGRRPRRPRENTGVVRTRDASYVLTEQDLGTLQEIGKFRIVDADDLARFLFDGDDRRMQGDLARLAKDGLISRQTVTGRRGAKLEVVVLTTAARRLIESRQRRDGEAGEGRQRFYADLKKPAEVFHDAAIYRMYQDEASRIRRSGGKIRRVILDYELKKKIYRPLAKARSISPEEYRRVQEDIARSHGLTVVDGKIPLPDLRIEYENAAGESARVDLELATGHYKGAQMLAKLRAGFHLYVAGTDSTRGTAVRDERELTAGILSL
jgi:hypothetical protein